MREYTKADLERIVLTQLENLNAMHDLLTLMKTQTELINRVQKKMERDMAQLKKYPLPIKKPNANPT